MVYGWDGAATSFATKVFGIAQLGNAYVMTGFVETPYDTSLYLIKTNDLGETGCFESETPLHAVPHSSTPTVNDLTLSGASVSLTMSDLPLQLHPLNLSIYVFCDTPTGILQEEAPPAIYPNPVKGMLYLKGFSGEGTYELYDNSGCLLEAGNKQVIDMHDYIPGIYFLHVTNGTRSQTWKVIREPDLD